ncbi:MAG: phosphoribosyltransferase family protein, partial [bacterium]
MKKLYTYREIENAIDSLANSLKKYILDQEVHFITILKEGVHFSVDLAKKLQDHLLIFDYIFLENVNPSNRELAIEKDIFLPIKNKIVIVCSVLTRTGYEISFIHDYLKIRGAKEVKTVSLVCKDNCHRKPDFYYFSVPQ